MPDESGSASKRLTSRLMVPGRAGGLRNGLYSGEGVKSRLMPM